MLRILVALCRMARFLQGGAYLENVDISVSSATSFKDIFISRLGKFKSYLKKSMLNVDLGNFVDCLLHRSWNDYCLQIMSFE